MLVYNLGEKRHKQLIIGCKNTIRLKELYTLK